MNTQTIKKHSHLYYVLIALVAAVFVGGAVALWQVTAKAQCNPDDLACITLP